MSDWLGSRAGLLTDQDLDANALHDIAVAGFAWVAPQVQNNAQVKTRPLARIKQAGLRAPVWGVTYRAGDFFRDGATLAEQAVRFGATDLIMDVEQAAKGTRVTRGLKPIVDGARVGGWTGPVHLNTMGPPYSADVNDYEIDLASFLETGGGVFTQAHFNETPAFRPAIAVDYWTRVGVPRDRLNLQISLYPSEGDKETPHVRLSGIQWLELLDEAGLGAAFSVFMAEGANDDDLAVLGTFASLPPDMGELMEKIGSQHGITGFVNWLRAQPGVPRRGAKYNPNDVSTWPWPDKLERALKLLVDDHDLRADE